VLLPQILEGEALKDTIGNLKTRVLELQIRTWKSKSSSHLKYQLRLIS